MAQIVVVQPGQTDVVSSGPQFGVPYTLIGPDGTRAVFNAFEDPDYVGSLSDVTGLDSPEIREFSEDLVEDDGSTHSSFYYGRRPVVLEGQIDNRPSGPLSDLSTNVVRNLRMTRLTRATNAMRKDAVIRFAPEGGLEQQVSVRRQQPLRITGAFNKTFQAGMVAEDPRIYSAALREVIIAPNVSTLISNVGIADTHPSVTLFGPATNPIITNLATGEQVKLTYVLAAGAYLVLDFARKTVLLNGATSVYSSVDFVNTDWWTLLPGANTVSWTATATTTASSMRVNYRDAWI